MQIRKEKKSEDYRILSRINEFASEMWLECVALKQDALLLAEVQGSVRQLFEKVRMWSLQEEALLIGDPEDPHWRGHSDRAENAVSAIAEQRIFLEVDVL